MELPLKRLIDERFFRKKSGIVHQQNKLPNPGEF
jgi:hypothetical protein